MSSDIKPHGRAVSSSQPSISSQEGLISFGSFELDVANRSLRKDGEFVALAPKAMELLLLLASAKGRIVEKQAIQDALWPGLAVEEGNLTQTVFLLRKALGETSESPVYLVTVPRRGYRFVMPVPEAAGKRHEWKRPAFAALLLVLLAGAGGYWWRSRSAVMAPPDRIIVLPFANMSPDADAEYFGDGLTEELIDALTRVEGLKVVARTTSFYFKGKSSDIRQIGKQVDVDKVIEGSVRKSGNRIRVTAQLNDAKSGYHYWSKTFDREAKDILVLQEEIAAQVAASLRRSLSSAGAKRPPRNIEAWNLYLRGKHEVEKVYGGGVDRGIDLLGQAIAKDPLMAEAHAQLANAYALQAYSGQAPAREAFPKATASWRRALGLDENLAEAHAAKGSTLLFYEWNFPEAERTFRKAIALNPSSSAAREWYAHYLVAMGRLNEAKRESLLALEADPLNVVMSGHLAWHYLMEWDFPNAITAAKAALAIDPLHRPSKSFLRAALFSAGRWEEGLAVDRDMDPATGSRGIDAYRLQGAAGYWKFRLDSRLEAAKRQRIDPIGFAFNYAWLGKRDSVVEWLRRAYAERQPYIVNMKRVPEFRPFHADPEFQAIAREIGLP